MATEVGICNQAFSRLGANTITALTQDTEEGRLANANYPALRDAVLQEKAWGFNTARFIWTPVVETPVWGYAHKFLIPSTVLRVLECRDNSVHPNGSQDNFDWRVEGQFVVCDAEQIFVKVAIKEDDPSKFSPAFEQALVARLEAEFAMPLTNSGAIEERKTIKYEQKKSIAGSLDGRQGKNQQTRSNTFTRVR